MGAWRPGPAADSIGFSCRICKRFPPPDSVESAWAAFCVRSMASVSHFHIRFAYCAAYVSSALSIRLGCNAGRSPKQKPPLKFLSEEVFSAKAMCSSGPAALPYSHIGAVDKATVWKLRRFIPAYFTKMLGSPPRIACALCFICRKNRSCFLHGFICQQPHIDSY